ncbi:hypothetical protein [Terrabacter sp. MAHUQ-38]|uniref:hypothetical protein n=1 Tax=unclassified Terrabacter TaxID=2630222 RepID=UPI00165D51E0|nr:hypothetical protein [Terrabacter sp. MAHUQ-38]MBC9822747.1 hypothetical protein [Terrabacter sp. MAHUQ-38]
MTEQSEARVTVETRRNERLAEHIKKTVDEWPIISTEQRDRLAVLLLKDGQG